VDKKGYIHDHSKIKLELYRLYLYRYLSVLLSTPFFESIEVRDLFAGSGISQNEQKGSALIAAETIDSVRKERRQNTKPVFLKLNDANEKSCADLKEHLKAFDFVSVTCADADRYIESWKPTTGSHNLVFIDPHGYTQVSTDNLTRLFTTPNCDSSFSFRFITFTDSSNRRTTPRTPKTLDFSRTLA
jgi:three-Cys-motif partner protein